MNKDKNIFDEAIEELVERLDCETFTNYDDEPIITVLNGRVDLIEKALQLGKLYKRFFEKLDLSLGWEDYDDWEGTHHYEVLESKLEEICFADEELIMIFKKIKELENDRDPF